MGKKQTNTHVVEGWQDVKMTVYQYSASDQEKTKESTVICKKQEDRIGGTIVYDSTLTLNTPE